jgi:HSP20 family molecular chaperone IbpA
VHAHCDNGELTVSIAKKAGAEEAKAVSIAVD